MEFITYLIDLFLRLDAYLAGILNQYDAWTYAILFFVIFMETGFVVTPFLPGDSLLFAAGAFAAPVMGGEALNIYLMIGLLSVAAILGDTVNYWIGHFVSDRAYGSRWVKRNTSTAHTLSLKSTAARRFSWRASSPSSAPSRRS